MSTRLEKLIGEKELKSLGIEVKEQLEYKKIENIANKVATKLTLAFPEHNISCLEIYCRLLKTPMYYAQIPKGMSRVNYLYKNSSIYFSKDMKLEKLDEETLHECIHKLQEHRDKKGRLTRMGICEVNEITVKNTALNEAAVQYIVAKTLKNSKRMVNVYNITLPTRTEYYPIITNLITQIAFLLGEEKMVDSTINSNQEFKYEVIDNFGESAYNQIINNFDNILKTKNSIVEIQKNEQENDKIKDCINNIEKLYFDTQNIIFTSYFNRLLKRLETIEEVNDYRKKMYSYKSVIGWNKEYNTWNEYFLIQDKIAKEKINEIQRKNSLVVVNNSFINRMFRKIKQLFINPNKEYNK